ncbi:MAG TPA: LD-carboxypeptidase [Microlunatus sp.]
MSSLVKPPALRPGVPVGLISTSSPITADQLDRIVDYFEQRGHPVRMADGLLDRQGYLAGPAERRAAGLNAMFADPEVGLVLPVNGGTGAWHLVDLIDYPAIRARPKIFTGFSNPTTLNNALLAGAGLASVHGVTGFSFSHPSESTKEETFWQLITGGITGSAVDGADWRVLRGSGEISGPVIGGNLYAFRPLVGTRWLPDTAGAILLLEAMTAGYFEIDAALSHLRLAGVFDRIAGLVIGDPADWDRTDAADADIDELILRSVGGDFPVITGVPYGHRPDRMLFPIGCRVAFHLDRPRLRYLEELVS